MVQATLKGPAQEAMNKEIKRQILESEKKLELDMDCAILWALHTGFGFGKDRLEKFYRMFVQEHKRVRDLYEIDDTYPERMELLKLGVDVKKLQEEEDEWLQSSALTGTKKEDA